MTMYPCYLPGLLGQPSRCLFVLEQRDNCFAMESGVFTLLLTDSVVKATKGPQYEVNKVTKRCCHLKSGMSRN